MTRQWLQATVGALALLLALPSCPRAGTLDLPRPPCDAAPEPGYPQVAEARANAMVMQVGQGAPHWAPPACTGWSAGGEHGYHTLVGLAGRFRLPAGAGAEAVLHRLGEISAMRAVRYWSDYAHDWRPFALEATALAGPDPAARRADFTSGELASGQSLYFLQRAGRMSGEVVYRLRVHRLGPDRLLVQTENVTPMRFLFVTLFQPGALQTMQVVERLTPTDWGYYILSRSTEAGTNPIATGYQSSYVNRAEALFRFVSGEH
jgi:hypothetical protein